MLQKFYKYHGAGNDFLLADNRDGRLFLSEGQIRHLCDRHTGFGADGVILLESSSDKDFRMVFYNPDGSGGMMCGNGGRCVVAFASHMGVVSGNFPVVFEAPDGTHEAVITTSGSSAVVRLGMKDVSGVVDYPEENSCFIDTGTRHLVKFVDKLDGYPVEAEGKALRWDPRFAPQGTNVDFVEPEITPEGTLLHVRTFEKGVEGETLACGTGMVASALVAYLKGIPGGAGPDGPQHYGIRVAVADLFVDFLAEGSGEEFRASEIHLTGPAAFVGTVECFL